MTPPAASNALAPRSCSRSSPASTRTTRQPSLASWTACSSGPRPTTPPPFISVVCATSPCASDGLPAPSIPARLDAGNRCDPSHPRTVFREGSLWALREDDRLGLGDGDGVFGVGCAASVRTAERPPVRVDAELVGSTHEP